MQGDMPMTNGFARQKWFWKVVLSLSICAVFIGLIASCFMNITDKVPEFWVNCDFSEKVTCGEGRGQLYWFAITILGSVGIGIFRWATDFPQEHDGLFKDIRDRHVDYTYTWKLIIISASSLCAGATLGPEAAMGHTGGAITTWFADNVMSYDDMERDYMVIGGMAAALGCVFPSPILGPIMISELQEKPMQKTYIETTMVFAIPAIIAFVVYFRLIGPTWIDYAPSSIIYLSEKWIVVDGYADWQNFTAFAIGVIAAPLCFGCLLFMGIQKQIVGRIKEKCGNNKFLVNVMPLLYSGIVISLMNYAQPSTVGNGSRELGYFIKYGGLDNQIGIHQLWAVMFARMFNFGASMAAGYIGGPIFPILTIGTIAGCIMARLYPWIPQTLSITCFMFSLMTAMLPMPITFVILGCLLFFYGSYQAVPLTIACFTSHFVLCGSGFIKKIMMRQIEAEAAKKKAAEGGEEQPYHQETEEDFKLHAYKGSDKKSLRANIMNQKSVGLHEANGSANGQDESPRISSTYTPPPAF